LDYIDPDLIAPASQARWVRMRARGEAPANLEADPLWQARVARIAELQAPPPLVLEGQS
jgi:hypothetical protein